MFFCAYDIPGKSRKFLRKRMTHDALAGEIEPALRSNTRARLPKLENISVDYAILEPAASRNTAPQRFRLPAR